MISGAYGMNVEGEWMPFSAVPHGFTLINLITAVVCLIFALILRKRKLL